MNGAKTHSRVSPTQWRFSMDMQLLLIIVVVVLLFGGGGYWGRGRGYW
jgi:hypothetical protein